jgi:hypothetical protein
MRATWRRHSQLPAIVPNRPERELGKGLTTLTAAPAAKIPPAVNAPRNTEQLADSFGFIRHIAKHVR